MRRIKPLISSTLDRRAAVAAGLIASAGYVVAMEADLAVTGHNADDLLFLGRPLVGRHRQWAKTVGFVVHLVNGAVLALAYASFTHHRLSGPPWWRGVLFANLENGILYPLTLFETHHPAIRDGQLDRYWHLTAFFQSIPRHIVYGALLGALYARWRVPASGVVTTKERNYARI